MSRCYECCQEHGHADGCMTGRAKGEESRKPDKYKYYLMVDEALKPWIEGQDVIAKRRFLHSDATTVVITRDKEDRLSLFRAFLIGNGRAEVSADLQDVTGLRVIEFLLEHGDF